MQNTFNTTNELIHELRAVFDDREFIDGILLYAETEYARRRLLEFIHNNIDVTVETITVLALELDDSHRAGARI